MTKEPELLQHPVHDRGADLRPKLIEGIATAIQSQSGCSADHATREARRITDPNPTFSYTRWRHGGWYVGGVRYPSGACGCVSNNYPDKKWRIVCDDRRNNLHEPGDFTFRSREDAARAEHGLAMHAWQEQCQAKTAGRGEDAVGAALFFDELQDTFETLGDVGREYGLRTLTDLVYLQNAILVGSFIDAWPEDSSVLSVVNKLASADRWMRYVKVQKSAV